MTGKVILVGAGPGDAGLMTLAGKAALESAEVVVYDKLVGQGVLAMIPPTARLIDVGKRAGDHPVPQHEINRILLNEALAGYHVVRLKGGDPFLFGRGGEELELLAQNGVPFEIVPGITSAISVPAYAGIPVTHRDCASSLHIITGHTRQAPGAATDYEALVRLGGTLVFLMGVSAMPDICAGLIAGGMRPDMPAAMLERGTTAHQRRVVSTVSALPDDAAKAKIEPPAVLVVGEVCALSEQFHWAEDRPLGGMRIVVTRPRELASGLSTKLRALGAEVVELPCIAPQAISPNPALCTALAQPERYGWLVFTSPSGVKLFFAFLREQKIDIRRFAGQKVAAIGAATRDELEQRGVLVELMPDSYSAAALGTALAAQADGKRVLLTRAKDGSPELTKALDKGGVPYDDIALYETRYAAPNAEHVKQQLAAGEVDYVAFTSASTVRGFAAALGGGCEHAPALCIGAQTAAQAAACGMKTYTAKEATIDSMIELLMECRTSGAEDRKV